MTTRYQKKLEAALPISSKQLATQFQARPRKLKRSFDIVFSSFALLVLAPLFLFAAVLILLEDGWPIFYVQDRVGKKGKVFKFLKFRSMYRDADARRAALFEQYSDSVRFKMRNDPRITRVGRLIRKGSIDELPQFVNVLLGDMTVVGPRPALPDEVSTYTPHQMQRLLVDQGLTCIWQISGRSLIPFEDQVELDIQYIREQSWCLDIKLILLTIPAVLSQRGAY